MKNPFFLKKADSEHDDKVHSQGPGPERVARRAFLRKSGGATVSALIAGSLVNTTKAGATYWSGSCYSDAHNMDFGQGITFVDEVYIDPAERKFLRDMEHKTISLGPNWRLSFNIRGRAVGPGNGYRSNTYKFAPTYGFVSVTVHHKGYNSSTWDTDPSGPWYPAVKSDSSAITHLAWPTDNPDIDADPSLAAHSYNIYTDGTTYDFPAGKIEELISATFLRDDLAGNQVTVHAKVLIWAERNKVYIGISDYIIMTTDWGATGGIGWSSTSGANVSITVGNTTVTVPSFSGPAPGSLSFNWDTKPVRWTPPSP